MLNRFVILLTVGVLSACSQGETGAQAPPQNTLESQEMQVTNMSATDAAAMLKARPELVVLDIRTPKEFAAGHIDGALNINFRDTNFAAEITKLDGSKDYLVHCRSGRRSTASLKAFKANGFKNIIHMNRGMVDWKKSGLAVVR